MSGAAPAVSTTGSNTGLKFGLIFLILAAVGGLVWYMFFYKSDSSGGGDSGGGGGGGSPKKPVRGPVERNCTSTGDGTWKCTPQEVKNMGLTYNYAPWGKGTPSAFVDQQIAGNYDIYYRTNKTDYDTQGVWATDGQGHDYYFVQVKKHEGGSSSPSVKADPGPVGDICKKIDDTHYKCTPDEVRKLKLDVKYAPWGNQSADAWLNMELNSGYNLYLRTEKMDQYDKQGVFAKAVTDSKTFNYYFDKVSKT